MLINHLSKKLILDESLISNLIESATLQYKKYEIDKKDGGKRTIYQPAKEIKTLQRTLLDDFLMNLPVHSSATAYVKGKSTKHNVLPHLRSKYFLKIDFKGFFESITDDDIRNFITDNAEILDKNWQKIDTDNLVKLVCFHKRLTIGSVTSPAIANAICYQLDCEISGLCEAKNIIYTRYADDLFFSSNEENILFELSKHIKSITHKIKYPTNLVINNSKTKHSSRKRKVSITNLTITNDSKISIGHKKKRHIKSLVYQWSSISNEQKNHLKGYLAYIRSVEPGFINLLCEKYGATKIKEIMQFIEK